MRTILKVAAALALLFPSTRASAAGFALDILDTRATSMAAAVTASINDPAAAFYNPAGLAQGKGQGLGIDAKAGATMVIPNFKVTPSGDGTTQTRALPVFSPHFYAAYGINDQITVGLGLFTPFGLDINWPAGWPGARISTGASLYAFYGNPEVAVRLWNNRLRIGAGVQVVRATVELIRDLPILPGTVGSVDIGAGGWGVGGNGGFQLDLAKYVSIGAAYRSPVYIPFHGNVHFSNVPLELSSMLADQTVSAAITLPQIFNAGVAIHPLPEITIGIDVWYYGWQSFHDITVDFENPQLNSREVKAFHHAWNYHAGAEYALANGFAFRAGVLIDPSPSPSETLLPDLPDANRVNIGVGVGYHTGHYSADLGYMAVLFRGRESAGTSASPPFPAAYGGNGQVISLTLRYQR